MAVLFSTTYQGSGTAGSALWVPVATIPVGFKIWLGLAKYTSPDKAFTFELRTNKTGQTVGSDAATTLLYTAAMTPRNGTKTFDLYNRGRLHIVTVVGTSAGEKLWLALKSKSSTAGSFLYTLNATTE